MSTFLGFAAISIGVILILFAVFRYLLNKAWDESYNGDDECPP